MTIINTLSTLQISLMSRKHVADLTGALTTATGELSTGFREDVYADLGARSAQTLEFRNRMDRTESFVTSNRILEGKLEMMETSLTTARDAAQEFLSLAVSSAQTPNQIAPELRDQARSTLDLLISSVNVAYGGEYLFAGIDSDTKPMQEVGTVNPVSGRSPLDVIGAIAGAGPATAADAAAMIADLDAVFASTAVDPLDNYETTFFNGTDLLDGFGVPNPRVIAQVDDTETLTYGVQANDPPFRDLMKGLMMFAAVDVTQIADDAAYAAWAGAAVDALAAGIGGLDDIRVQVGTDRARLGDMLSFQMDRRDVYNNRIVDLEGVDAYETASRMQALQTQLEASYTATARIARLSFLNYM